MFIMPSIPLWSLTIVIGIWNVALLTIDNWNGKGKFVDNLIRVLCDSITQLISIVIITILILVSIVGTNASSSKKLFEDEKYLPKGMTKRATKANKLSSEFLLAYISPMITLDSGNLRSLALLIVYFSVLAFPHIKNNSTYMNILLELKGYRIYTCNLTCEAIENDHTHHDSAIISKIDLTRKRPVA